MRKKTRIPIGQEWGVFGDSQETNDSRRSGVGVGALSLVRPWLLQKVGQNIPEVSQD